MVERVGSAAVEPASGRGGGIRPPPAGAPREVRRAGGGVCLPAVPRARAARRVARAHGGVGPEAVRGFADWLFAAGCVGVAGAVPGLVSDGGTTEPHQSRGPALELSGVGSRALPRAAGPGGCLRAGAPARSGALVHGRAGGQDAGRVRRSAHRSSAWARVSLGLPRGRAGALARGAGRGAALLLAGSTGSPGARARGDRSAGGIGALGAALRGRVGA